MWRQVFDWNDPRHQRFQARPEAPSDPTVQERAAVAVDWPALDFRAAVGGVDDASRTIEVSWSTGAGVLRRDWATGAIFEERLSLDAKHVRLDRLNSGAPVLNAHNGESLSQVLGVVVENSARIVGPKDARATLRFSKRADVDPVYQDVRDKIIQNVSVGYRVSKYLEERASSGSLIRTAVDWEPYEISMVPMGADAGARVRGDTRVTNRCEIISPGSDIYEERRARMIADRDRTLWLAKARASS